MSAFYMQGIRNAGTKRVVAPSRRIEPALIRGQCRNGDPLAKVLAGGGLPTVRPISGTISVRVGGG